MSQKVYKSTTIDPYNITSIQKSLFFFLIDHVCGSAHCLLVPYWAQKCLAATTSAKNGTVTLETPMIALQASPRGGMLFVSWDMDKGVAKIGGDVVVWGKGEVFV